MNRITKFGRPRTLAATAFSFVAIILALVLISSAPSHLMRSARADGAENDRKKDRIYLEAQVAELHELHAMLHESGSGNGDPVTRAEHLAILAGLYADNATFTIAATGQVIKGRDAIVNFFAGTPMYNNDWLSMTVAFRTSFEVDNDGDSANISLECHWVDPATGAFKVERRLAGTASKIHGAWVLQDVTANAASL